MWPITLKNRTGYVICLIVAVLLMAAWASVRSSAAPLTQAVSMPNQPDAAPLHLEAAFAGNVLIGTLTVSDKDGHPWTDVRGQAELLDSTGQRRRTIPLQPLGPGEFRLIVPLDGLDAPGYLDVQLPGRGKTGKQQGVYQINPASRTVAWTEAAPRARGPLSSQATGGPDAFGYAWNDAASYNWIDMSGGTSVSLRDDDWEGPFSVGFTFNFYGQPYTQFYIDSNGYIGFDSTQLASYYSNVRLPSVRRPNSIVAPFWQDFDPSQAGTIRYRTFGSAGSRYLVVEWNGVRLYGTSDAQSFQVILYEGNDQIKFQYPATRQGAGGDLRYATVGIENAEGTIGLEYPYTIPNTQTLALGWSYSRPAYNVFLTPAMQGSSVTAGGTTAFHLKVRNLGANDDSFVLSRASYAGSNWTVSFYRSDGVTPLAGNTTDLIAGGAQQDIVAKVSAPGGASVGSWTRAFVQATSQGNGSVYDLAMVDAMFTPSFYQVYTDDDSGDGTEDSENYVDPIVSGAHRSQRQTTDVDNSNYAGVANTPDGNAVTVWNTNYWNSQAWVSDIQYAVANANGGLVRSVARLTNNSAATLKTYDFAPAVAVAPNGNILIDWAKQVDSDGDLTLDRYDAWYAIVSSSGATVRVPTALTNNASDYPRDYPPSVAALTGGNFLLTWEHGAASSGPVDIYYTVVSSGGSVVKGNTRLTDGIGWNITPRAAALPNGKAAIVWTSYNSFGNGEIYYSVLNADGSSPSAPAPITANGSSASSDYAVAEALSNGQLAVAWTGQISGSLQSQIQYTIVDATPPVSGISGQVTFNGSGVGNLMLNLIKYDGMSESRYMTTTTQADGSYSFAGAGNLTSGQYYYVRYWNGSSGGNTPNTNYVVYWFGPTLTSYTAGANASGGNWDIANVSLVSPSDGGTLALPVTFQWTPRGIAEDNYIWALFDLDTFAECWGPYQTTGSLTLNSTGFSNCGLSYSVEYGWYVYVIAGNAWSYGYGASYYYRTITFSSTAAGQPEVQDHPVDALALDRLPEPHKARLPGAAPALDAVQPRISQQTIYTVPNLLNNYNIYVSLAVDDSDRLIMTWLDNANANYLYYALADQTGANLTPATILQRTRHSYLWSSWNGYGNAYMPPQAAQGPVKVYLPLALRNYSPPQPVSPVTNGGFETGNLSGWTAGGGAGLTPRPVTSQLHSGSYAAVLGQESAPCQSGSGGLVGQSWLYQDITVPNSGSAQLTFYYRIFTYDKLNADKYDRFEVYVNGTLLSRLGNTNLGNYGCSKPINDLGWQLFNYDLSVYRGQTIRLQLVNVTYPDDWYGTWTYVDDVTVN